MKKAAYKHEYEVQVRWTGNQGPGTTSYTAYSRSFEISTAGKPIVYGSSDPHFRGDNQRYSPEELLVAALSSCHMLWYLHLCADAGITVVEYQDSPIGSMIESQDGGGCFESVILKPQVYIFDDADRDKASALHGDAHRLCFLANSMNFPVRAEATIK